MISLLQPEVRLEGRLTLAPQMQYALTVLQMDCMALQQHIRQCAMENPLISLEALDGATSFSQAPASEREVPDTKPQQLRDLLLEQIPPALPYPVAHTLQLLIDILDDDGYLRFSPQELAVYTGASYAIVQQALKVLHQMEPRGVGAATLSECLTLQLQALPAADSLACRIAEAYLPDLAAGRLRKVARAEHVPLSRVEQADRLLRTLSPLPANGLCQGKEHPYITPDLRVFMKDGQLCIALTGAGTPSLRRSETCLQLLAHSEDPDALAYLRQKKEDFSRLEQALLLRAKTLLAVTQVIVETQSRFFLRGEPALAPLTLKDISQQIGLHLSTVGRAIQNKYLICEQGTFPLKFFLSRGKQHPETADTAISQQQIEHCIHSLIEQEDPHHPLSDNAIFQQLQAQGIPVSRRSVLNYRERMGIPSSYVRKQK